MANKNIGRLLSLVSCLLLVACSNNKIEESKTLEESSVEVVIQEETEKSEVEEKPETVINIDVKDEEVKKPKKVKTLSLLEDGQKMGMKLRFKVDYSEFKEQLDEIVKNSGNHSIVNVKDEFSKDVTSIYFTQEETYNELKNMIDNNENLEIVFNTGFDKMDNFTGENMVEFAIEYTIEED